jgi:hypothetical protein
VNYLAPERTDIVAPDKNTQRHDTAEDDQHHPTQYLGKIRHLALPRRLIRAPPAAWLLEEPLPDGQPTESGRIQIAER